MKSKKIKKIMESLYDIESLIGSFPLKLILQRIFYELGKKGYEVPESPSNIDLSNLNNEELDKFEKLLFEIVASILGEDIKQQLIEKMEEKYGED